MKIMFMKSLLTKIFDEIDYYLPKLHTDQNSDNIHDEAIYQELHL